MQHLHLGILHPCSHRCVVLTQMQLSSVLVGFGKRRCACTGPKTQNFIFTTVKKYLGVRFGVFGFLVHVLPNTLHSTGFVLPLTTFYPRSPSFPNPFSGVAPRHTTHCITPTSAGGVVRLCGAQGLEPALVAAAVGHGGSRTPILPVVISSGTPAQKRHTSISSNGVSSGLAASSLPEGALVAISKHSPRPCYYRIDRERLFCREAWQPVAAEMAAAGARSDGREGTVVVVEADSLSSGAPQTLMSSPVKSAVVVGARGGGGSENSGGLGEDQAVWGLEMLRRALEEKRERESLRVASVLLAERRLVDVEGSSTVSIDARAALMLSVLSWAQQCAAEAVSRGQEEPASSDSGASSRGDETAACSTDAPGAPVVPEGDAGDSPTATQLEEARATTVETTHSADAVTDADADAYASGDDTANIGGEPIIGGEPEADGIAEGETTETEDPPTLPPASTAAKVLGVLENMGRGVRVAVAPFGQLLSTVVRSLSAVYCWVEKSRRRTSIPGEGAATATSPALYYDTDDNESFQWLAAQVEYGVRELGGGHVTRILVGAL